MHLQSAIALNEAKFPESVHEEIHSWAGCTNHFRQSLLAYIRDHSLGFAFFPEASQYQKRSGQPFLARIEQLIDQVRLSAADRPLSILTAPVVEAIC
jgi:hypothetical protein